MSFFSTFMQKLGKVETKVDSDLRALAKHAEDEFEALKARIEALEKKAVVQDAAAPAAAPAPANPTPAEGAGENASGAASSSSSAAETDNTAA
jgi:hypothetical protein